MLSEKIAVPDFHDAPDLLADGAASFSEETMEYPAMPSTLAKPAGRN
jgi:hypothetical protein